MADFLTRLIERSIGATTVVQPLLAPAFSTAPETGDAPQLNLPEETIKAQSPATHSRQATPQPAQLSEQMRQLHAQPLTPQSIDDIAATETEEVKSPPPARERMRRTAQSERRLSDGDEAASTSSETNEPRAEPRITPPSSSIAFAQETLPPLHDTSPVTPRSQLQNDVATEPAVTLLMPLATSADAGQSSTSAATKDERTSATPSLVETSARPQGVASPVNFDAAQAGRQLSDTERANKMEATAAPTIRVSIGRIEVRAVAQQPQTAPPQQVSRPAPRISLDEYLRSQNGGRR